MGQPARGRGGRKGRDPKYIAHPTRRHGGDRPHRHGPPVYGHPDLYTHQHQPTTHAEGAK